MNALLGTAVQPSLQKKQVGHMVGVIERSAHQESDDYATHKALQSLAPTRILTNTFSPLHVVFLLHRGSWFLLFPASKLDSSFHTQLKPSRTDFHRMFSSMFSKGLVLPLPDELNLKLLAYGTTDPLT